MNKKVIKVFAWLALIAMVGGVIATILAPIL
jgi:hypothetical protein